MNINIQCIPCIVNSFLKLLKIGLFLRMEVNRRYFDIKEKYNRMMLDCYADFEMKRG